MMERSAEKLEELWPQQGRLENYINLVAATKDEEIVKLIKRRLDYANSQLLPGMPPAAIVGSREKGTAIAGASDIDLFVDNEQQPLTRAMRMQIAEPLVQDSSLHEVLAGGEYSAKMGRRALTLRSPYPDYPDVDIVYARVRFGDQEDRFRPRPPNVMYGQPQVALVVRLLKLMYEVYPLPAVKGRYLEETAIAAAEKCATKRFYHIAWQVMEWYGPACSVVDDCLKDKSGIGDQDLAAGEETALMIAEPQAAMAFGNYARRLLRIGQSKGSAPF